MADRVLIVAHTLGNLSETFIYRQVVGMKELEVVALVARRERADLFPLPARVRLRGFGSGSDGGSGRGGVVERLKRAAVGEPRVVELVERARLALFSDPWVWSRSRLETAKGICREFSVKAVLAHYGVNALAIAPAAFELGLPLVAHFHGHDASRLLGHAKYVARLKSIWPRLAGAVTPSEYLKRRLVAAGLSGDAIRVIGYGAPLAEGGERSSGAGPARFLHVGRLVEKKGVELTVSAFGRARSRLGSARLMVVGEGPRRGRIERLIGRLGLGGRVELLGARPNPEVLALMDAADVFVQHSLSAKNGDTEGLPVGILEAMAHGLPVISTRHAGIPEAVLEGESGYLVDEGDVEAMAERMVRLGGDQKLRLELGRRGRAIVADRFELSKQNAALEARLKETIYLAEAAKTRVP